MALRPTSFLAMVAAVALVGGLPPSWVNAQQQNGDCEGVPHCGPYSEDPGDGCLGPDDPFCNGGGGNGAPSAQCQVCDMTCYGNGTCTISCEDAAIGESGRSECQVTVEGEDISCETWGAFCDNIEVGP